MKTIIIDGAEYNLTPKVLFKKGDFVVIQETTYLISKIEGLNVTLSCNGRECLFDIDVLKNARLYDITKDAKDGDVLNSVRVKATIIFKNFNPDGKHINAYCALQQGFLIKQELPWDRDFDPATKERRELLFQKMKEEGYEWDAEKKELKKIEQKPVEWHREDEQNLNACLGYIPDEFLRRWLMDAIHTKYDKPAWSEEDETGLTNTIIMLKEGASLHFNKKDITKTVDWLKSFKDRVQPQPKQEWSEEDIRNIDVIDTVLFYDKDLPENTCVRLRNWLESLKPQNNITDEELVQAKKDAYNDALDKIEYHSGEPTFDDGWSAAIDYIRKKYLRPQQQWKPTEEQVSTMKYLAKYYAKGCDEPTRSIIEGLYEQLKQL